MDKEEWMPQVGQGCEALNKNLGNPEWEKCRIDFVGYHTVVYTSISCNERSARLGEVAFRPIQSEADKHMDEQIENIQKFLNYHFGGDIAGALTAYEAGIRIISPDERVCKPLSDEQIKKIIQNGGYGVDFINSVQNAVFGGEVI